MKVHVGQHIGAYRVHRVVDESEYTTVGEVRHTTLGTRHALKILTNDEVGVVTQSLVRCSELQAELDHPNVVRCTDRGRLDGLPWLVMDWMDGGSLADLLDVTGAIELNEALRLFRAITAGVGAMHAAGVVHRDLKPQNVLLLGTGEEPVPRITDLALAKRLDLSQDSERSVATLSTEFRTIGTPEYMSPEQCVDPSAVDTRSDLYALGIMLYELVTNEVPYDHPSAWKVLLAARSGVYRSVAELRPEAPPAIDAIVARLIKNRPQDRFASTDELLRRLDLAGL